MNGCEGQKEAPIGRACSLLSSEIEEMKAGIEVLLKKLTPILSPAPPSEKLPKEASPPSCSLEEGLRALIRQNRNNLNQLNEIIERIQV